MEHKHSSIEWEQRTLELVRNRSILEMIGIQVAIFTRKYDSRPEIIQLNVLLRPALVKEIIGLANFAPEVINSAVIEPIWISDIPALCNIRASDSRYIVVRSRAVGKEHTI